MSASPGSSASPHLETDFVLTSLHPPPALNPLSSMGPLISRPQLSKSEGIVASSLAEGLTVECGGKRMNGPSPLDGFDLGGGYFFQPTVLSGDGVVGSKVWKEEVRRSLSLFPSSLVRQLLIDPPFLPCCQIFGPVICVAKFSDEADAIKKANDCDFGLGGSSFLLSRFERTSS